MLRRVLFTVLLAALGLAGAASAALVTARSVAPDPSPTTTGASTAVTTPTTAAATTSGTTTTAGTKPAGTATATVTTTTATTPATTTGPVPSTLAVSAAPSTVVITGHGWGHGLGMSQWGTLGFAQHGWTHERILAHYYRGTTLEERPNPTVRVLLFDGATRVTLASESPWSVTGAHGAKVALAPGKLVVGAALVVSGQTLASPLTFSPGKTPLSAAGKPYRGRVLVFSNGKALQVVNALKLEPYVKGVVGYEMPASWPAEALEVQAVAARSYALANLTTVVTARAYDVFSDTRSQVYGGIQAESPAVSKAVDATARRVVVYDGAVVTTYYSSSSGGRTVSAAEAFGKPIPYLVSVSDPYDTLSPNHDWGPVLFDARKIAKALKLSGELVDLQPLAGPSGHVARVTAVAETAEATVSGSEIRTLLGLRSTWFSVGWLELDPPARAAFGVATQLSGIARGAGAVTLEERPTGGTWQDVAAVTPDAKGTFTVTVEPQATTQYRLAAGDVRAALVSLAVEPVVKASVNAGAVSGTVRPPLPGAAVQLQRQSGTSWATVATSTTDTTGSFAVAAAVGPGSYRVRCAPGRGLSPGVSRMLAVS